MEKTVASAVSELRTEIDRRNTSIRTKITSLEREASSTQASIDQLMRSLVDSELASDTRGQVEAEKKVKALRGVYDDIAVRIEAYRATLGDPAFIRPRLVEIFQLAADQQAARMATIRAKIDRQTEIEKEIRALQEELPVITGDIQALNYGHTVDNRDIASLLSLIDPRQVEPGQEIGYLQAFAAGRSTDAFLPQEIHQPALPVQQFGSIVATTIQRQPGPVCEPRDLCRGVHANAGFVAQQ